ncbi:MAG: hypothetical protein GKR95_02100 [Gammaproteobacteria bacterium]|nr:hypothetical protein [Gammaproteobacteria bacterium]
MEAPKKTRNSGRPRKRISAKDVYEYTCQGLTRERIASKCGVSKTTFQNRLSEDPKIREAYERGTSDFLGEVEKTLGQLAIAGDGAAIRFILQTRDKDSYSLRQELTGADNGPIQVVAAPMTPEERRAAIIEIKSVLDDGY